MGAALGDIPGEAGGGISDVIRGEAEGISRDATGDDSGDGISDAIRGEIGGETGDEISHAIGDEADGGISDEVGDGSGEQCRQHPGRGRGFWPDPANRL